MSHQKVVAEAHHWHRVELAENDNIRVMNGLSISVSTTTLPSKWLVLRFCIHWFPLQNFEASSPNGRFAEGAAAITGRNLARIEAHGKNLFYFFITEGQEPVVVHIHFGMSGRFSAHKLPGKDHRCQLSRRKDT